ncbi:hypothetical protein ACQZV8_08255 [Magnetococcales bacterium HHB-1]
MIDKTAIIAHVITRLKKQSIGMGLDLRTYKRNRSIQIIKKEDNQFLVKERGYHQETFEESLKTLPKRLKVLLKKEFPRSNKVRVYTLEDEQGREIPRKI